MENAILYPPYSREKRGKTSEAPSSYVETKKKKGRLGYQRTKEGDTNKAERGKGRPTSVAFTGFFTKEENYGNYGNRCVRTAQEERKPGRRGMSWY